jgi:16S rRNA (cytosine967-C5)-methyltransferase
MKIPSLIGHAAEVYGTIRRDTRPADALIDLFFRSHKYLGSHDRRFIAETVYGVLRHKIRLEWILAMLKREGKADFHFSGASSSASEAELLCLLFGILMSNESVESPEAGYEISVDDRNKFSSFCSKAKDFKRDSEIGQSPTSWNEKNLSLMYSFPQWMIALFEERYGIVETAALCASLNEPAPLTIRVNTLKTTVEKCQERLLKEGLSPERTTYSPFGLHLKKRMNVFQLQSFRDGWFEVQDEGSQILSLLVDPKPSSKVVDACAGGGGKSLSLSALMKNRGEIFALDTNKFRLDGLRKRIRRSGSDTIRISLVTDHEIPARFIDAADNVLVDAPCSGLGTLRRNPGMKWTTTPETVDELSKKQYALLSEYARCVKRNGRLVYSTCTMTASENEGVVERFLSEQKDFELMRPSHILERYGLEGLEAGSYIRLFPHVHGTDGFFGAVMKRKN